VVTSAACGVQISALVGFVYPVLDGDCNELNDGNKAGLVGSGKVLT
jgi:hypothetical protein